MTKRQLKNKEISRRKFLKHAGIATGGVAVLGITGVLAGCAKEIEVTKTTKETVTVPSELEVLSPLACSTIEPIPPATPLDTLKGKTIGQVWIGFGNGDILQEDFVDLLSEKFEDINFIKMTSGAQAWGAYPDESIGSVATDAGVDAVIVTVGG